MFQSTCELRDPAASEHELRFVLCAVVAISENSSICQRVLYQLNSLTFALFVSVQPSISWYYLQTGVFIYI